METTKEEYFSRPRTDRKLTRVKSIYFYIRNNESVTIPLLMDEFGMSRKTILRDLDVLQYNGLIKSPKRGKWVVTSRKVKES